MSPPGQEQAQGRRRPDAVSRTVPLPPSSSQTPPANDLCLSPAVRLNQGSGTNNSGDQPLSRDWPATAANDETRNRQQPAIGCAGRFSDATSPRATG
jgi:hypothetical protein